MTGRPEQDPGADGWQGQELDELLGLDPEPRLSERARGQIHARLSSENARVLDALLGTDEVEVPHGLADRVLAAAHADQRRRRFRRVGLVVAAAAASLLVVAGAGWRPLSSGVPEGARSGAVTGLQDPSEELLAALPLLESLDFLEQEFDPFEREVALAVDPRDAVFFELLELGD